MTAGAASRVRLTGSGWWLGGVAAATYAFGGWAGYDELIVVGAAGLLVCVIGLLLVARRPAIAVERRIAPDRVSVGELAEGFVMVTNVGNRRSPGQLCREVVGATSVEVTIPPLAPQRAVTIPYALPTDRRAVLDVGPMRFRRADPFGLVERRSEHGSTLTLRVHPRVHHYGPPPSGRRRDLEGPSAESERGSMVFHALREYVVGDDLRRVHWKATAHTGALMVREHVDPARPDATIVVDDRAAVCDPDRFEVAVEVAASAAVACLRHGFPARLRTVAGSVGADGHDLQHRNALLDVLAAVTQAPTAAGAGLERISADLLAGPGGRVLLVATGDVSTADLASIAVAGRRFEVVVVVTVGEGPAPPAATGVLVRRVRAAEELTAGWGTG